MLKNDLPPQVGALMDIHRRPESVNACAHARKCANEEADPLTDAAGGRRGLLGGGDVSGGGAEEHQRNAEPTGRTCAQGASTGWRRQRLIGVSSHGERRARMLTQLFAGPGKFHCTRAGRLRQPASLPGPAPRAADRPAPCPPPPEKTPVAVQRRPARPRRACAPPDPGSGPRHPQIPQRILRSVQLKWRRWICCAWSCRFLPSRVMASHRSWSDHWFAALPQTGGTDITSCSGVSRQRPAVLACNGMLKFLACIRCTQQPVLHNRIQRTSSWAKLGLIPQPIAHRAIASQPLLPHAQQGRMAFIHEIEYFHLGLACVLAVQTATVLLQRASP